MTITEAARRAEIKPSALFQQLRKGAHSGWEVRSGSEFPEESKDAFGALFFKGYKYVHSSVLQAVERRKSLERILAEKYYTPGQAAVQVNLTKNGFLGHLKRGFPHLRIMEGSVPTYYVPKKIQNADGEFVDFEDAFAEWGPDVKELPIADRKWAKDNFITLAEAKRKLGLSDIGLRKAIGRGLPHWKYGRYYFFPKTLGLLSRKEDIPIGEYYALFMAPKEAGLAIESRKDIRHTHLSFQAAARALHVRPETLRAALEEGIVPHEKIGRRFFIPKVVTDGESGRDIALQDYFERVRERKSRGFRKRGQGEEANSAAPSVAVGPVKEVMDVIYANKRGAHRPQQEAATFLKVHALAEAEGQGERFRVLVSEALSGGPYAFASVLSHFTSNPKASMAALAGVKRGKGAVEAFFKRAIAEERIRR